MTLYRQLFKQNSDGKSVQVWEIHCAGDDSSYWTVSGREDGKKVTTKPTAVTPKVNRTQREQVLLEMDSKIEQKRRKKYVDDRKDVGKKADDALPGYSAMLAKKWEDQKKKIAFPCVVQPKLDGIRCLAMKDGFFTRGRKEIEACAHIRKELEPFFQAFPDARLDGELYSHDLKDDFERIIKAVRKTNEKATEEDFELQRQIEYHIYDVPRIDNLDESSAFVTRFAKLRSCFEHAKREGHEFPSIRFVAFETAESEDVIMAHNGTFVTQGYEGTMIRNSMMPYEGKRSNSLLKLKSFDEDEFEIVGMNEGKGNLVGHCGNFVLVTKEGNTFKAKMDGSLERLRELWLNPNRAMGFMATVRFQGLTNKERVPRFPVLKEIRGPKAREEWL